MGAGEGWGEGGEGEKGRKREGGGVNQYLLRTCGHFANLYHWEATEFHRFKPLWSDLSNVIIIIIIIIMCVCVLVCVRVCVC